VMIRITSLRMDVRLVVRLKKAGIVARSQVVVMQFAVMA